MWEDILMLAIGNGLWAVLSCVLLGYLVKDSKKREAKFTKIVEDLADRLKVVGQIQDDVKQLGERVDLFAAATANKTAVNLPPTLIPRTRSRKAGE